MKGANTRRAIALALAALLISGNSYAKQAGNQKEDFVDCGSPNASLQDAIDSAAGPTIITFVGSCLGDLLITQDDITLQGQTPLRVDEIVGEVDIVGARRTRFSNMTIRGGANGIDAYDGAVLRARDIVVTGAGGFGVGSFNGAVVVLTGVDINNNGGRGVLSVNQALVDIREGSNISDNGSDGVGSFNGAVVILTGVDINNNGGRGVNIGSQAMVDIREGSNISDNGGDGVGVFDGSLARIGGATVEDNAGYGVKALGSMVSIQKSGGIFPVISGNTRKAVDIGEGSSCRIEDATISSSGLMKGALTVSRGSNCTVRRSTLTSDDPADAVVHATSGASLRLADNDISHTAVAGLTWAAALNVGQGASVELNSEADGNTLAGNGYAILVGNGGNLVQGYGEHDTINGDIGINFSSHVQFLNATINGNISMRNDSFLRLRNRTDSENTVVNGNVELDKDSSLEFRKSPSGNKVTVYGNVICGDAESSYSSVFGDSDDVTGVIDCTGFEQAPSP